MKSKANKILRNILIGAIASLYNSTAQATDGSTETILDDLSGNDKKDAVRSLRNKIYHNVLAIKKNGDSKLIAGHRSHMSHRSGGGGGGGGHYSHASHYSSYGGGGSSRSYSNRSRSSSSYSPSTTVTKPAPKTYKTYSLGDRTLTSGEYGNDVSTLTSLLVTKKYLKGSWISMQNGYPLYDRKVISAVKRFQKDAGLPQNGTFTASMVNKLENWDSNKSTLTLGIRDLSYNAYSTLSGYDVNELIALLRKTGFPPDPAKLQYKDGKAVYTPDLETAVKLFQAYNSLNVDGVVDEELLSKLKRN